MAKISIKSVSESNIPKADKIAFFEKELRSGKTKIFKGLKQIKKNIGDPSAMQGVVKVREGHAQVVFAKQRLRRLKGKKYWK